MNAETQIKTAVSYLSGKIFAFLFISIFFIPASFSQTCDNITLFSAGTGNFTDANRWSNTSGGAGNYTYNAADPQKHIFIIENGHTITVNIPVAVSNLIIGNNGAAASVIVNAGISFSCANDSLQIKPNGILQLNGNYLSASGANNRFAMRGGLLRLNSDQPAFLSDFENIIFTAGTVVYNFAGNQTINSLPYHEIILSGSGVKSLGASITVKSNITISAGTTLEILADNANISIAGNWINQGNFNTNNRITYVEFNNTVANQSITGYSIFHGLRINKALGSVLSLNDSIRINSNISFTGNGILSLGTSNLILSSNITQVNSSIGSFNAGRMIRMNGTSASGKVIKELQSASGFVFSFPLGTGTLYTPVVIGPLSASVSGTGRVTINTVPYTSALNNIVKRYGTVSTSGISDITRGQVRFYYDQTEETGTPNRVIRIEGAVTNPIADADADLNNNYFGAGSSNTAINGEWRYISATAIPVTYYTYQDGDWNTPVPWTTDPTGTTQVGMPLTGPSGIDNVVILNGRKVTMSNNNNTIHSVTINNGGTLNLQATTGHSFGDVYGQGTMQLSSVNLPIGNYSNFVAGDGGTIEYFNFTGTISSSFLTYNNLVFSGTGTKTIGGITALTYSVNGNLNLTGGNLIIGSASNTRLNISENLTVAGGCNLSIPTANLLHQIFLSGNFINEGNVRFTNRTLPVNINYYTSDASNGRLYITFNSASSNQVVNCNGPTYFYRIIVDKGTNDAFSLRIQANAPNQFYLLGRNDQADNDGSAVAQSTMNKALSLQYGTLILGENINIPSLTQNNNFRINQGATLMVDSASVLCYIGNTNPGNKAFAIYGRLTVNRGSLDCGYSAGAVLRTTGTLEINGGKIRMCTMRPSTTAAEHRGTFIMTGGVLNVDGYGEETGCSRFSLPYSSMVFKMSGGIINLTNPLTTYGGLQIGIAPDNYQVTGGTFNFYIPASNVPFIITSSVPFYNLNIYKQGAGNSTVIINSLQCTIYGSITIPAYPLNILNNLYISGTNGPVLNTNSLDLYVSGNMSIDNGGNYTTGTNTTYFTGTHATQNVLLNANVNFSNLVINNTLSGLVNFSGSGTVNVTRDFSLLSGTLNDGGKTITVNGNLVNSATHIGSGRIRLNNGSATPVTIGGSGNGIWGNLQLDDTNGALITARQTINGTLTLTSGILDIGSNRLAFTSTGNIPIAGLSATRMIRTSGLSSDEGISKALSTATTSFTFPFGTGTNYTPATISVTAGSYGTIAIKPVNMQHPLLTIPPATVNNALRYYWSITSQDFSGITAINNQFDYTAALIPGGNPNDDNSYRSAMFNTSSGIWTTQNGVNEPGNRFTYIPAPANLTLDGDYTAGLSVAFGPVTTYESISAGNWETPATWRRRQGASIIESPSTTTPGASNPVIIRSGHTVTVTGSSGAVRSGSLQVQNNAMLDLGTTISTMDHNFGTVICDLISGSGTLKLSSSGANCRFPAGDFANFLGNTGGTVIYERKGTNFTIPTTSINPSNFVLSNYNNLEVIPTGGTISLPAQNLRIYKNLTTNATAAGSIMNISNGANGNIQVDGKLSILGNSSVLFINDVARTLSVNGDVTIAANAAFDVLNSGTAVANSLILGGSILNNGILRLANGNRYVNTTFAGTTNASFTGVGTTSVFNRLILNKGIDTTYTLTVNASAFSLQATTSGTSKALELINGTFKLASDQDIILSSGVNNGADFEIPASTQLWIEKGSANITASGTTAGMFLSGKLKITADGTVNITSSAANDNYIEYSGVGSPTIEIGGNGQLIVGSQIRRLLTSTNGSLHYIQYGGNVTVGTQSVPNGTRAVFEVLNTGSEFTMEGGTLTIARQQSGTSIAALYLSPSAYNVAGGTINLGSDGIASANLQINSSIPLWNLVIGTSTPTTVNASLNVNELTVMRNLTIQNGATLTSNNLNVSIGGNLMSFGNYVYGTNTTIFDGNINQSISGSPAFNNLVVNNTLAGGLVTLNNNISVNGQLSLLSGILSDNGYTLTSNGNIENSAEHRSSGSGRIVLKKTGIQLISGSGNGVFGSMELDNAAGVYLTTNQTINNNLTFTRGILHIDNHKLTLGNSFNVSGTPSDSAMIKTSGSLGDNGIQLNIVSGNFGYLIPMGVSGKYTPARYTSSANPNSGYIIVKPVNSQHPLTSDVLNKEMNYYWRVSSNGLSGTTFTQEYSYNDLDVIGRGIESEYIGTRYSGTWTLTGIVNSSLNRILFPDVNYIDGDYTAGEVSEFNIVVSAYQTANSGDWEDGNTWVGGIVPVANANVIINQNHKVTINTSSRRTYSLYLCANAELIVGATTNHNFGITHGTGTLTIGSNIFPGGDYSGIVAADSGTIKYTYIGNITNVLTSYNNLVIESSGTLSLPFVTPITIRGNLNIQTGTLGAAGQRIILSRNFINNGTFSQGNSTIDFRGTVTQTVGGGTPVNFWNMVVNNAAGINFDNSLTINNNITFTNGLISLSGTNEAVFSASATHNSASDASYINGMVRKISTGSGFIYPVGNGQYRPVTFGPFNGEYTLRYNNTMYNPAVVTSPVTRASDFENWEILRVSGTSNPDITLRWTNANQIPVISSTSNLRMVYWNASAWEEASASPVISGNLSNGAITVNGFANSGRITFGSTDIPVIRCPAASNVLYTAENMPTADSYVWTTDNGSLVSLTPDSDPKRVFASFTPTNEGVAHIILTVSRGAAILAVKSFAFQVYPAQPIITVTGSTDFCEGGNVQLSVPAGFNAYEWNSGQITPSVNITASGNFSVRVQHTNNCWSSFSETTTVVARPVPAISTVDSNSSLTLR